MRQTDHQLPNTRIGEIDMLRGLALAGIIAIHHIEHFHVFAPVASPLDWFTAHDDAVHHGVFFWVSGKAYALFSLLFGYSYWIQIESRARAGAPYGLRHFWRMALLFGFGLFHSLFYSGDILIYYALLGCGLYFVRNHSPLALAISAIAFLAMPLHLLSITADGLFGTGFDFRLHGAFWQGFGETLMNANFWEASLFNLSTLDDNFAFQWNEGRVIQICGLFLLGLSVAKAKIIERSSRFWLILAAIMTAAYFAAGWLNAQSIGEGALTDQSRYFLSTILRTQQAALMMLAMASAALLAWRLAPLRAVLSVLAPFGRLGLSNYILSSLIGAVLYYGWGLGLHDYLGAAVTFTLALGVIALQVALSHLWLVRFKQGPLEALWRRATWRL